MSHVTEVVLFRLNEGTQESDFLRDSQTISDLLKTYDGCIQRELSTTEDGLWVDIVIWKDMQTALSAAEQIVQNPIFQQFEAHIKEDSVQMYHAWLKLGTPQSA